MEDNLGVGCGVWGDRERFLLSHSYRQRMKEAPKDIKEGTMKSEFSLRSFL